MKKILATLAFCTAFATQAWAAGLIVVEDLGGASALPARIERAIRAG